MALINTTGIVNGSLIQSEHVTRIIDALSSVGSDTIAATGSLDGRFTGIVDGNASFSGGFRNITLNMTVTENLTADDYIVTFITAGAGTKILMLPDPGPGKIIILQRRDGNIDVVVSGSLGGTINNAAGYSFGTVAFAQRIFVCEGVNWYVQPA